MPGRLVLIDFGGASEPHVGTYEGTEGYVAPDLRLGKDRKYSVDGDLYALSISLHEWLLGCRPGKEIPDAGSVPPSIAEWLKKGASPDSVNRYHAVQEMKSALQTAVAELETAKAPPAEAEDEHAISDVKITEAAQPERTTVMPVSSGGGPPIHLSDTSTPCTARSAANENALAESQARNPFFGHIHVAHPVADVIHSILIGESKRHVVLTGHAGDGKSTLAVDIFRTFVGPGTRSAAVSRFAASRGFGVHQSRKRPERVVSLRAIQTDGGNAGLRRISLPTRF